MAPPTLAGRLATLRPAEHGDAPAFADLLAEPEVARWWGSFDLERVRRELVGGDDETEVFAIVVDGAVEGLIQYWEEEDPGYRHAALDIGLHPRRHGQGIGADAIRTLARHLIDDRGHHRLTIDPAADNVRAIRSYERVGFRPVGVMRRYERTPEGDWRDGLLMDLLADELQ